MPSLTLEITMTAPLHLGVSADGLQIALDSRGDALLTATALKGAHRASTEQIARILTLRVCDLLADPCGADPCAVCRIFGSRWTPGLMRYRDLTAPGAVTTITRTRAAQSRRRGRHEQRIATTETHAVVPAGVVFKGTLHHFIGDPGLLGLSLVGLRAIAALGAGSAQGWGACQVRASLFDNLNRPVDEDLLAAALRRLKL
jgi:hypothetical protein